MDLPMVIFSVKERKKLSIIYVLNISDKWKIKNDISISVKSKKETANLVVKLILKGVIKSLNLISIVNVYSNQVKIRNLFALHS